MTMGWCLYKRQSQWRSFLFVAHREEATEATEERKLSECQEEKTHTNTTWLIWAYGHSRFSPRGRFLSFYSVTSMMSLSMTPLYKEHREASEKHIKLLNQFKLFYWHQLSMKKWSLWDRHCPAGLKENTTIGKWLRNFQGQVLFEIENESEI